jgi:diguanylate cyclase (GGDEF)-like protein
MKEIKELYQQLNVELGELDRLGLRRRMLSDNIRRGMGLAWLIIAFEAVLAAMDVGAAALKVDSRFHFTAYLAMYLAMILFNVLFMLLMGKYRDQADMPPFRLRRLELFMTGYISLLLCWGSVISLMDQKLYGQLIVFMVNLVTCSVLFYQNNRQILVPYGLSAGVLLVGLPFFQPASDMLVGHYVNLLFFLLVSWTSSRILYVRYCNDFKSRVLLMKANERLEVEIENNKTANLLLADANRQLRKLSLVDELTGIPNRRSFRNYIDTVFAGPMREGMHFSIVMMDLDFFKEYNDNYGHSEADRVLAAVAGQMQGIVRHSMDILARWGGEEFIYAAFDIEPAAALAVAERMRESVLGLQIPHEYSKAGEFVSASFGVCTLDIRDKGDISRCVERADRAMYRAKAEGRNRIAAG